MVVYTIISMLEVMAYAAAHAHVHGLITMCLQVTDNRSHAISIHMHGHNWEP